MAYTLARLTLNVPPELAERIEQAAKSRGKSKNAWLTEAVKEKLEKEERDG